MARAQVSDFLQNMRFFVDVVVGGPSTTPLTPAALNTSTGFMSCSVPDIQVDTHTYREGHYIYERKYPGIPTMNGDISLTRGVTRGDSSFWYWLRMIIEGSGEYRADLDIKHFHRDHSLVRAYGDAGQSNLTEINKALPGRTYHVFEAYPNQHKIASDLDATNGDVSIMELNLSYEHFEVEEHSA